MKDLCLQKRIPVTTTEVVNLLWISYLEKCGLDTTRNRAIEMAKTGYWTDYHADSDITGPDTLRLATPEEIKVYGAFLSIREFLEKP